MTDEALYACPWCLEDVLLGEPKVPSNEGTMWWHRECMVRQVVGSVGHLQRRCPCYGGTETDPPEMTRREAARAACELYHRTQLDQDD